MHPVDALMAFSNLQVPEESNLLGTMVLDFTGGGLLSTDESIAAAKGTEPTQKEKSEMGETGKSMIEAFEGLGRTNLGEGIAHGVMVTSMWDLYNLADEDILKIHEVISGATVSAMSSLIRRGLEADAFAVTLLGMTLYRNAASWNVTQK